MNAHLRRGVRELWAVRWVRTLAWIALVAVGLRLLLVPALGLALDRLAAGRDLAVDWEELELELHEGRGRVTRLVVTSLAAGDEADPPLLELDYAVFDLDLAALLSGDLRVARAEVDGLTSRWVREADGRWNAARHVQVAELLELLESEDEPEGTPEPAPQPIDLAPPLAVDALRLQEARLLVTDRTLEPALEFELSLDAALSDLRLPGRPARFSATLTSRGLVDSARVEGRATWDADSLRVEAWARGAGLRPSRLEPYLAPFDVHASAASLDARCELALALDVRGEARDALGGELLVADVAVSADGREALALDALSIVLDAWSPGGAELPLIELRGPRGQVVVEADSSVRLAGFSITGDGWEEPAEDWLRGLLPELRGLPAWAALLVHNDVSAYPWQLGALALRDGAFELEDRRVEPAARVPLLLDRVELRDVVHDPVEVERRIPLDVALRVPGVLESATLEGHLDPFAPARHVDLRLVVEGIDPEGLDGYLRRLGLERDLRDGRLELALEGDAVTDGLGRSEGRVEVRGVSLRGEEDLFGVERLAAEGVVVDPEAHLLRVGELAIEGPRLALGRDPSQRFFALGLRTLGLDAVAAAAAPVDDSPARDGARAAAPAANARPPLRIELERVRWSGTRVTLSDALHSEGAPLLVDALDFTLEGLVLDGDPEAEVPAPARLSGRISAGEVVDALDLSGELRTTPGRLDLSTALAVRGSGLRAVALAGYLRPLGVEPALVDGTLALDLRARLAQDEALEWVGELELADLSLEDQGRTLLAFERLAASEVRLGEVARVGALELAGARAALGRDADGALRLPGLRVVAPSGAPSAAPEPGSTRLPRLEWPALPPLALGRARVSDARLEWRDTALAPPLELRLELELEAADLGTLGAPGTFAAALTVPDVIERLGAEGELRLGAEGASLALALEVQGLRAGPLARLLPPGVELEPAPARLRAGLSAEARPLADGGLALRGEARDVALAPLGDGEPWLALSSAALALALEPAADTLRVEQAAARGVTLAARRGADGTLHALGLRLTSGAAAPPPAETPADGTDDAAPAATPRALPRVALQGEVGLEVARVRFHDERLGAGAPPLEAALELSVATPAVLVGPEPEALDALELRLALSLTDLLERLEVAARATPFAAEPAFDVRLAARGLRTAGLAERLPALAARAQGTLEQGTFDAHLAGTLGLRRSSPTDLGLGRPFSAELTLADVALREREGGEPLAGVARVSVSAPSVDLARGRVHVAELEVERPSLRAARLRDGRLHALGLALALEPPPPAQASAPATPDARPVAVEASARRAATGELRVDRVLLSGLDVRLVDEAVDPPMHVPLVALDGEIAGLSTRLLEAPGSVRFDVVVAAGPGASTGEAPVFEELAASGRLSLFPEPSGRAQIGLTGLSLTEFSGLAAEQGLALDDGALDASTRLRLSDAEQLRVDTSLAFSDLDLSEPEGGWLERLLSLPVALDTALFLLRNPDGEHRFSTGVTLDADGVSTAQLAGAAGRAFAEVLAGALAGAPLRLLGSVLPLGDDEPPPAETWSFDFDAGATELEAALRERLDQAARHLEANPGLTAVLHGELSAGDLERASALANPSAQELHALVAELRRRRAELAREHGRLVAQARVERALGELDGPSAPLRAVARERAEVERSLDALLEVLRSDQPRRRERRARAALREIAELRLEAVRDALARRVEPSARERLEVRARRPETDPELERGRVVLELRPR